MADLTVVDPADLATYLGQDVDQARATLLLQLALGACQQLVSPVPEAAKGVVLSVAARAYESPSTATNVTAGPFSVQRPAGGIYLTRADRQALKGYAGRGGAFTVDPTPTDAGNGLYPWGLNVTWLDRVPLAEDD